MFRCFLLATIAVAWCHPVGLLAQEPAVLGSVKEQPAAENSRSNPSTEQSKSPAAWRARLLTWRAEIVGRPNLDPVCMAAREAMLAIDDPSALSTIMAFAKRETDPRMKWLCWQVLANLGGEQALDFLVDTSVLETDASLRVHAAKLIAAMPNSKDAIPRYARYLRTDQTANAAATSISYTNLAIRTSSSEPIDTDLAYALVDALQIKWREAVYDRALGRGYHASSKGVHYMYRAKVVYVVRETQNEAALETLREYSLVDYGYDQKAWRNWLLTVIRHEE
jgi:hypothetical protein